MSKIKSLKSQLELCSYHSIVLNTVSATTLKNIMQSIKQIANNKIYFVDIWYNRESIRKRKKELGLNDQEFYDLEE